MLQRVRYDSTTQDTTVEVIESRDDEPMKQRAHIRHFGNSAKAQDDGLIFAHGVQHGEIKLDDIMPPWED